MNNSIKFKVYSLRFKEMLRCGRGMRFMLLLAALLLGGMTAGATDYVITYTSGGTTYYIGMNGNNQLVAKTVPDATCVWTAINTNNTNASSLSTNTRKRIINKQNNTYYLYVTETDNGYWSNPRYTISLSASTSNTANSTQYWYGGDGSSLYYYRNNNYGYGYLHNSGSTVTISSSNTNAFVSYAVTVTTVNSTSTGVTINSGADILTATGNSNYTTQSAAYRIGYTNYQYNNNANHYFDANGNSFTGTPAVATISYSWSLTPNDYATVSGTTTTGTVDVSSLPEFDITLMLTVTATATGGTPAAPANTIFTDSKQITIQGTKPAAPTISVSGTTVTLSTDAIGSTTIRYTLDGTDPSASTGTVYSGAFDVSGSANSPVVIKAVTVRSGNASDVSTETVTLTLPAPTITADGAAGTATITATAGTTIYYTTNGTTPTTSSSQYSGSITGLTMMQTIKAIAVKSGWNDSPVASEIVKISSSVSGGTVTLFDYEDHNWTYYSGVSSDVDGGSYNTSYNGTLYSPDPRNVKITYKANGGAVSIDESETEFVYYKTIEKVNGTYTYTVISNPFSKRPNGKGFNGWKITGGATYINGKNTNDVLSLDATITLENFACSTANCTAAEIELTADWVNYNNKTNASGNSFTYSVSGGTYETNFLILNRNVTGTITVSSPCTIMMVEPDGSSDYRNTYTFTGNITPNNSGVTKIEFTKWNSTNTLDCNNHSVTIGRGMTTTSQCASYVTGVTGKTNNYNLTTYGNLNYHLKIESGKFTDVSFIAGTDGTAGYVNCNGTSNQVKGTLGNDYDRAKGDDTKLDIADELFLGYRPTYASGNQNNANFTCWVKSGNLCSGTNVTNTTFNNSGSPTGGYYGDAQQCFYVSSGGSQTNIGKRKVYVEGGTLAGIAGGIDANNSASDETFFLRMTGGTVRGVIYGSGAFAAASGQRRFVITGGTVKGWIAAGCNGTDPSQSGGTLPSNTYIYVGGNVHVGNETDLTLNTSTDGNVFGAGSGNSAQATTGQVNNSNVVIADQCYVKRNVYGGGNYGYSNATATLYVTGGEVAGSVFGGSNQKQGVTVNVNMTGGLVEGGVYGGSNVTGTISQNVIMKINGGQVGTPSQTANIHGGGYGSATRVTQNVEVTLGKSGQTAPGVTVYGDVYGGSALGYVNGTAATNTYHTYVTLNKGIINGSLYGGALGDGSTAANVYGPVQVKVYGGSVRKTDANGANGSGGVYGANNVNGAPQRAVTVDIYGTDPAPSANEYALFAVYGGGNAADYTYGNGYPKVTVHNCDNSIEYVYGGGNAAQVQATDVKIYGGNKIGNVFGGGNGTVTAANVTDSTHVDIFGGTILHVFGGSNSRGTIGGTIKVNAKAQTESGTNPLTGEAFERCPIQVGELYGGGNMAASNVGNITIGCMNDGDLIDYVYGGSNNAAITGDISLTMTGGRIGNLFGGNNTGSTISGGINVTVNWNNSCSNNYLGNVFGGGNLAQYTIPDGKTLQVNILNGTVSGNVYGGGKGNLVDGGARGSAGKVTGNPAVTIGDNNGSHTAIVSGDVYGGGDAADVAGIPVIVVNDCNTEIGFLYGGGNAADVNGTSITFNAGTVHNAAFGGGHGDKNASNPSKYADVNGNVSFEIKGGTIAQVFAGSNSKGTITGSSALTISKVGTCAMKLGEVYSGGNEADGNAGSVTIGCTGTWTTGAGSTHEHANLTDNRIGYELEGIGTVYGGANQANIGTAQNNSNITLNVNSGMVNRVFGGNNTSGTINGTIAVNINKTSDACSWYVGDVFGGGNLAAYSGSPSVTLTNGTVSGNIYGGGNEAGVGGSTVNINGGAMTAGKGIYGGCNTSGTVTGNIAVNINGGTLGTSGDGNALYGIFGGGYGASTATEGNVTVTIGDDGGTKVPTIYGDIYGGSALGSVNNEATDLTKIDFLNGVLHGNIYGGGLGDAGDASKGWVNGEVQVNISSESQAQANCHIDLRAADIYGCNNTNGSPQADVTVHIWKTGYVTGDYSAQTGSLYAIDEVFGGGNQADYAPENGDPDSDKKATVYVHDCLNSIRRLFGGGNKAAATGIATTIDGGRFEYVFGGGNGEVGAADVGLGGTNLTVHSGRIAHLFGGSNTNGTIYGPMGVSVDYEKMGVSGCDEQIDEFFGGGNEAVLGDAENPVNLSTTIACNTIFTDVYGGSNLAAIYGNVTLTVNGGTIQNLYGGSKGAAETAANITGNIKLNIYGGDIGRAYGGSNINGNITGTIGVDLDWSQSVCSQKEIDYIYGGSNQTAYTPTNASGISPDVKLINGTVNERVYGGGRGSSAVVTSNPRVTAGAAGKNVVVLGSIFGGGDAAQVSGNTDVNVIHSAIVGSMAGGEGNIFGGGNAATVTGDTKVYLGNRAKIYGNVYGGGNQGEVNGDTKVIVNSD